MYTGVVSMYPSVYVPANEKMNTHSLSFKTMQIAMHTAMHIHTHTQTQTQTHTYIVHHLLFERIKFETAR